VKRRPIIVTRAGEAGQDLARALTAAGEDVLWLPAFDLGPAPDEDRVEMVLRRLQEYDLAVFVSPAAVDATARRLAQAWPARTAIGSVGETTRRAILTHIPAAENATLFTPEAVEADGEGGGSEPLWHALQPALARIHRVLILRAEHGREWLGEQLAAAGAEVETLAVYTRRAALPTGEVAERLRAWQRSNPLPVLVVASSEAVDAVLKQLDPVVDPQWTRSALALASHERIGVRLRAAGFANVKFVALEVEAIRQAAFAQ
jgi:uroporphyrinogen-III synthase